MENDVLKRKKEEFTTKVFWNSFQTIFIFGIPAFLGAFIGLKLDNFFQTGRKITLGLLLCALIFSWTLICIKYYKLKKDFRN